MSAPLQPKRLSRGAQVAIGVVALLLVAAAGYFFLIGPKRSEAARLDEEIVALEAEIADLRARAAMPPPAPVKASDLYRLAKAMPSTADMPEVLLELNRIAADSGIVFESISPGASAAVGNFQSFPISLIFEGNFYTLSDFLFRLRSLVKVHDGRLDAEGRLFSVDNIAFTQGPKAFPTIQASLTVSAFVYGTGTPATPPPVPTTPATETTPAETATTPTDVPAAPTPPVGAPSS